MNVMKTHPDILKYYAFRALIKRIIFPVLVLYMVDSGLSIGQIAFIAAVSHIISIALEVPSGMISDTLGHKKTLTITCTLWALSMGLYFGGSFPWIAAGAFLYMGAGAFYSGTVEALLYERLEALGLEKENQKYAGRARSVASTVGIVTMTLAGVLYQIAWWLPFMLGVLQFISAGLIMMSFKHVPKRKRVDKEEGFRKVWAHLPRAWGIVKAQPEVFWMMVVGACIFGATIGAAEFNQVLFADLGLVAVMIGFIYSLKRFIAAIVAPFTHKISQKTGPFRFYALCGGFAALYLLLVSILDNTWAIIGINLLSSANFVFLGIASNDFINQRVPSGSRATILSLKTLMGSITISLFTTVFGLISHWYSIYTAFFALGVLLLLFFLPSLWKMHSHRAL